MEKLTKKTLDVSRGFTYAYYTSPAKDGLQTFLLIHGFPDSPEEYADVVRDYLVPNGYGVIAVDCLGYSGSSKPLDAEAYSLDLVSRDFSEILDQESVDRVICTGHDWGSALSQRFYNFYPERVIGLVLLNVAYAAPAPEKFNLDAVLGLTTQLFGYGTFWYWKLFTGPDGAQVLDSHLESTWSMCHAEPESWLDTLTVQDGARNYLLEDKRQPVQAYATAERREKWLQQFGGAGFDAPLNYYRSVVSGVQDRANAHIPKENYVVKVPHLFFGAKRDFVCRPEFHDLSLKAGLLPDCTTVIVDAGHWAHLALPKEFGVALMDWLKVKF